MKQITRLATALLVIFLFLGISACNSLPLFGGPSSIAEDGSVVFIDLDVFDTTLAQSMRVNSSLVTVTFPNQPVTVNDLPERLQRWLSAVHSHGGGILVETKDGFVKKDLMSVMGIIMSGYKLAKRSIPALMGRHYKAVIVLDGTNGVVGKVDFIRL